ncbi:DUF2231 domain-containing protein [Pedobacter heparinus]|uniref:DUF2231 domain-containing protein n=1 Tax=Pedobacter heparinus TaxID=984 RepID=UPI00292F02DE|nr:DUF2231 domain-containing protein [Pedobacter heparinus]
MNQVPSIWRTELWHPMLVHFPVATLLLTTIAGFIMLFLKKGDAKTFLSNMTSLLLFIGVLTGWLGIYTGLLSYNIVVRQICDPEVLQDHQNWGYIAVILYSCALACLAVIRFWKKAPQMLFTYTVLSLLLAGGTALGYCGHLGAAVVYQQGGGTYTPSANCTEFVR